MTTDEALRAADGRRRRAMIDGDLETLASLLAEDLVWTHSSGKQDDKAGLLRRIGDGGTVYQRLEVADDAILRCGEVLIHHGLLSGEALVEGAPKPLRNRFLSVWIGSGDDVELLAWQSTGV